MIGCRTAKDAFVYIHLIAACKRCSLAEGLQTSALHLDFLCWDVTLAATGTTGACPKSLSLGRTPSTSTQSNSAYVARLRCQMHDTATRDGMRATTADWSSLHATLCMCKYKATRGRLLDAAATAGAVAEALQEALYA